MGQKTPLGTLPCAGLLSHYLLEALAEFREDCLVCFSFYFGRVLVFFLQDNICYTLLYSRRYINIVDQPCSNEKIFKDFPGGPVVEKSPANTGDTGLMPGAGRFHMPRGS